MPHHTLEPLDGRRLETSTPGPFDGQSLLIASLPDEERAALLSLGHRTKLKKGESLFRRGDKSNSVAFVESGRLEISTISVDGRRFVINYMGPGAVLGEIGMLDGGPRSADVIAATAVVVIVVDQREVKSFLSKQPDAMWALIAEVCGKARATLEMFEAQVNSDGATRLARCLLRLVERWGASDEKGNITLTESFSQTELGDFSGLTRETVNRLLKAWEADGTLELVGRKVVIKDKPQIELFAALE